MTRSQFLLIPAFLLAVACPVFAQTYLPKTIQFKGDTEHTTDELMAAAGLKKGVALSAADLNDHTKLLMDSGIFDSINYDFNGQDLVFHITPARILYIPQLENFPFPVNKEFEAKLHERQPLYHGKVPLQGALLDAMRSALIDELASKGIQATISTASSEDLKPGQSPYMSFTISSPAIHVGEVQVMGASPELAPKARAIATRLVGSAFSTAGSQSQLEVELGNFYREQGYLEVAVHATAQPTFSTDADGVQIPFNIVIDEGAQYRLAKVELAPSMAVTQNAFDKQADLHAGEIASLEKLRSNWLYLLRQYHNQGYMKAAIHAAPTYDHDRRTVSYAVTADAGPVYSMGALKINTGSDDIRNMITSAWPMQAGVTFNEGAIRGMTATKDVNPILEHFFVNNSLRYTLALHDDVHTVDVEISLERKH
jgi:outer membrane protein assembly factor BamA